MTDAIWPDHGDEYRRGFEAGTTWAASLRTDRLVDDLEAARILLAELRNRNALLSARVEELERLTRSARPLPEPCAVCRMRSRVSPLIVCEVCR